MSITDEEYSREDEFLKGLPRLNVGALVMPAVWGPVHGFWITILYYPAWLLADNLFYSTFIDPTMLGIVLSISMALILAAVTVAFAIVSQPIAAHRALERGVSREQYLKRQRIWAVVCIVIAIIFITFATIYNLDFRTEV